MYVYVCINTNIILYSIILFNIIYIYIYNIYIIYMCLSLHMELLITVIKSCSRVDIIQLIGYERHAHIARCRRFTSATTCLLPMALPSFFRGLRGSRESVEMVNGDPIDRMLGEASKIFENHICSQIFTMVWA